MTLIFETSVGYVTGQIHKGAFKEGGVTIIPPPGKLVVLFDAENIELLRKRCSATGTGLHCIESGWIEIDIADDFYGVPEYKAEIQET